MLIILLYEFLPVAWRSGRVTSADFPGRNISTGTKCMLGVVACRERRMRRLPQAFSDLYMEVEIQLKTLY